MPGIYVNDGGGLQSAIGSILGGLATNMSPQAQAEAQNLRYRTEGQDISNRQALDILKARQAAEAATPGFLSTFNADAQPPGGAPTVASTLSSVAQPPMSTIDHRTTPDLSQMTPFQKVTASRIAQGDFSPAEQAATVDLGQSQTQGPGNTYSAIKTRSTSALSPGSRIDTSGTGAGPYITGGDEYGSTVARTTGAADPATARGDFETGAQADTNLGKVQLVRSLYDQFVAPNANPQGVLTEEMTKKLTEATGVDFTRFTSLADVKAEIKRNFASMVANMRDNMGQPMFKGGLPQIMEQFPDPNAEPERFASAVNALQTTLQQQSANGKAAMEYLKNPTPENFNKFLTVKGQNALAAGQAFAEAGMKLGGEGGGGGEGGAPAPSADAAPPAPPKLRPATAQEIVFARDAINKGQSKEAVIAHARDKGIDLGSTF